MTEEGHRSGDVLLVCRLPVRVRSASNLREHWSERARRTRAQRMAAYAVVNGELVGRHEVRVRAALRAGGLDVLLHRLLGPRDRRMDDDNLAAALKPVRDGVADALAVNDADPRITWTCRQSKLVGERGSVVVEIMPRVALPCAGARLGDGD